MNMSHEEMWMLIRLLLRSNDRLWFAAHPTCEFHIRPFLPGDIDHKFIAEFTAGVAKARGAMPPRPWTMLRLDDNGTVEIRAFFLFSLPAPAELWDDDEVVDQELAREVWTFLATPNTNKPRFLVKLGAVLSERIKD